MDRAFVFEEDGVNYRETDLKKLAPEEVVNMAKQYRGFVDWDYMSQLYGDPVSKIRKNWAGVYVWQDPMLFAKNEKEEEGWLFEEQYFNGKLRALLRDAEEMNKVYPGRFEKNVEALRKRIPPKRKLKKEDIHFGDRFISVNTYNLIMKKFFDLSCYKEIIWEDFMGKRHIDESYVKDSVRNTNTFGTKKRTACKIMERMLEGEEQKEYDYQLNFLTGKKRKVLNKAETIESKEKEKLINEIFRNIIFSDSSILEKVEEEYAETFDNEKMAFDGSYLNIREANLRPNQKNLLSRALLSNAVLGAQQVGSGKNYTIPFICHMKKERNLKEKNLVILGTNFEGTVDFHREFFPEDKILVVSPKDFTPLKYKETLRKIKEEDYVVIYMKSSSYDTINVSRKWDLERSEKEIKKYRSGLFDVYDDRKQFRALHKHVQHLEKEYCDLLKEYYDPNTCCFDSLGVTTLIVDECQEYKNIRFQESLSNVPGNHNNWSKKAVRNYKKVRCVLESGGSVVYLTGTPMKNSPTDLYVILHSLMPEELKRNGISSLKQWMLTFGERNEDSGIDLTGQDFVKKEIFSGYRNCEQLEALCSYVGEFYFETEDDEDVPHFDGYIDVVVKRSPEQEAYMMESVKRAENVRDHLVPPNIDNYLKITTDLQKCALDIRCVREDLIGKNICGKATKTAEVMKQMYDLYPGTTQIGFLDYATPKPGFNLYDELRKELVERGVPFEEIAFIHDGTTSARRRQLLKDFNDGKIRILLGSTQKLGVGVNVQENLIAIHHLDVPWNPAGLIQRNGRIIRRGNKNKKVFIFRYVTEKSFDAYMWQIVERKVRFFSTLLVGLSTAEEREAGLSARMVLDCAEIKALAIGNPLIKERVEKQNKVDELKISKYYREKELAQLRELLETLPEKMEEKKRFIAITEADWVHYKNHKKTMNLEEKKSFGEELLATIKQNIMQEDERFFKEYQGFQILLPERMTKEKAYVILGREDGGTYFVKMDGDKPLGCCQRLNYVLDKLEERKKKHEEDYYTLESNLKNAKKDLETGNPYTRELELAVQALNEVEQLLEAA